MRRSVGARGFWLGVAGGAAIGLAAAAASAQGGGFAAAEGRQVTGWSEPGALETAVLEDKEGANLAGARAAGGEPRIRSVRLDLNGDGIDEILYHVDHPFFCGSGECPVLVMHRRGAAEPWNEVAAVFTPSAAIRVGPAKRGGFLEIHAAEGRGTWGWDGSQYAVIESGDASSP